MKYTEEKRINDNIKEIYVIDDDSKLEHLAYRIHHNEQLIEFFPMDTDYFINVIYLEGFKTIPKEFSENGYMLSSVQYYLDTLFKDIEVGKFTISKQRETSLKKYKNGYHFVISYDQFSVYKQEMTSISTESKLEKRQTTKTFLATVFPTIFEASDISITRKKNRFVQSIDQAIIPFLSNADLQLVEKFVTNLIDERYISSPLRFKMITEYKENIDSIALNEAISKFETNYKNNVSEAEWGSFLKQYLFLLESKYIKIIPELNLALGTWRKVDFGLIDAQGYLDIYEIKRPTTDLLNPKEDHGNYFWNTEMSKAIVQAEKYLYLCERKAPDIAEAIKREYGSEVKVIKPRAILIAGHSDQIRGNSNMEEDLRILRSSLKNVEIILYDELYERLITQRQRTYLVSEENLKLVII